MGWEDRPYYRDRSSGPTSPLMWLMTGSVSLGVWFGINLRVHATLLIYIALNLLLPGALGSFNMSAERMAILFGIVLLHEFGHCFGSRLVGGNPHQIIMHPLGGLASADPPRRPWPTFITVLAGPLVNVVICLLCVAGMSIVAGDWRAVPWNPLGIFKWLSSHGLYELPPLFRFLWVVYGTSLAILLFNLWPVFPLDGGQMLQSLLWVKFGYFRATMFAAITGMVGAAVFAFLGIASGSLGFVFLAIWGFQTCLYLYRELKANGPWAYQDEDSNFAASLVTNEPAQRKRKVRAAKQAEKLEREAATEQDQIDQILAKVSAQGMHSLTWLEKRALHKATERQRARDAELSKARRKKF